ncbi:MAG: carbon-nitrogen hydrolase family protein [Bacteroidota bacterium]
MRIALAQIQSQSGQIDQNIAHHLHWIDQAIAARSDAIFFPELSLTNYEPELADTLQMQLRDERLSIFQEKSDAAKITIGFGMPLRTADGVQIAMLIFQPDQPLRYYAKQILHEDELPYFISGKEQAYIDINGIKVASAICYESLQESHLQNAIENGAQLYLASVAKAQKGINKANIHFPKMAKQYQIPILMVNSLGKSDNFIAAGQSGVWNEKGEKVRQLSAKQENLLLYE